MTQRQIGITILVILAVLLIVGFITTGWAELRGDLGLNDSMLGD